MKLGRLLGLVFIIVGIVFVIFPIAFAAAQHARVYVRIDQTNVSILESDLETYLPISVLDTYVRNLTLGDRTLDIQAVLRQNVIMNYQLSRVGTGCTLIRTNAFSQVVPAGDTVDLVLTLRDSDGSVLGRVVSQATAAQQIPSYAVGVLAIILGVVFLIMPSGHAPRKQSRRR